MSHVVTV